MITGRMEVDLSPLQGLQRTLVGKILRKAVRQAAVQVRDAVRSNAQGVMKTGGLGKSIAIKVKVYKTAAVAIVGPRSKWTKTIGTRKRGPNKGKPIVIRPAYYAHLLEGGSKRSRKRPFLKPAWDSTLNNFFASLTDTIAAGIEEQLSKG